MAYRYERKYYLSSVTAEILKRRVQAVLAPDSHSGGRYWVHNIYFDDLYNSFYQGKLSGSLNRDKYRVRYYNNDLSYIHLEHKRKEGERSFKRKAVVTQEQLFKLSQGDLAFAHELDDPLWQAFALINRTRRLRPAVAFAYLREAYVHEAGHVRITFDSRIAEERPGLNGVLEVKYTHFLPDFIAGLLSGLPLTQTEMSKYGRVMEWNRGIKNYDSITGHFMGYPGDGEPKHRQYPTDDDDRTSLCVRPLSNISLLQ